MEALMGLEFKILGSDLVGVYEKMKTGYKMLVMPINQQNNDGISIDELLKDINSLMGKTGEPGQVEGKELKDQLKATVPSNIKVEAIRVKLKTAFLYVYAEKEAEAKVEYAFSLEVITEGVLPKDINLVDVKKLSVSVWNTDRDKILNLMSLQGIDRYLEG